MLSSIRLTSLPCNSLWLTVLLLPSLSKETWESPQRAHPKMVVIRCHMLMDTVISTNLHLSLLLLDLPKTTDNHRLPVDLATTLLDLLPLVPLSLISKSLWRLELLDQSTKCSQWELVTHHTWARLCNHKVQEIPKQFMRLNCAQRVLAAPKELWKNLWLLDLVCHSNTTWVLARLKSIWFQWELVSLGMLSLSHKEQDLKTHQSTT